MKQNSKFKKMIKKLLPIFLFLLYPMVGYGASAGELGIQYNIRYTNPIVIGPVKQVQQGILPRSSILEAEEELAAEEGLSPFSRSNNYDDDDDEFSPFVPLYKKDFDETVIVPVDHNDLFSMLHINGARVTYQIRPLVHVSIDNAAKVNKPTKQQRQRRQR